MWNRPVFLIEGSGRRNACCFCLAIRKNAITNLVNTNALDLEATLVDNAIEGNPRPGLFEFLENS